MSEEEIKDLAEQCSLYYQGRPTKRGYELSNRLTIESYALMTFKWLSERYEIVAKEKVREEYTEIQQQIKDNERVAKICTQSQHVEVAEILLIEDRAKIDVLESLFPTLKSE